MANNKQNSRKSIRKSSKMAKPVRPFSKVQGKLAQGKKKLTLIVITQMLSLATSGFGLVAALAWNSLVQEVVNSYIKKFLPNGSGITSLLIYAIVVTILAVVVTYNLSEIKETLEK